MAFLLIGGSSRSLSPLSPKLRDAGIPCIITSRRGAAASKPGIQSVKFDWDDQATWKAPFEVADIKNIVMTAPLNNEPAHQMNPFIDFARAKGVARFALIAGLTVQKAGAWLGKVWEHLAASGAQYTVIKPIWFMDNMLSTPHIETIMQENRIYSGSGEGVAHWIAADDIAQVVFRVMTAPQAPEESYSIVGPAAVSMGDIAAAISGVTGRKIEYVALSDEANEKRLKASKIPQETVPLIIWLEKGTKEGKFDFRGRNDVQRVTGRPPTDLLQWAEANKSGWLS